MSSRDKGNEFELKVAKLLNLRQTANSGAMHDDADLRARNGKLVIAECKVKNVQRALMQHVAIDFFKLQRQAERLGKDFFYVIRDSRGDELVICELNFFAEATEGYFRE